MERVILKIYGDVQGVNFRWQIKILADGFGLKGWVGNKSDGTVMIVADGETEEILKKFVEKCYTIPNASVDKIDIEWQETTGEHEEFSINYDA
jgi:acylphosphatase